MFNIISKKDLNEAVTEYKLYIKSTQSWGNNVDEVFTMWLNKAILSIGGKKVKMEKTNKYNSTANITFTSSSIEKVKELIPIIRKWYDPTQKTDSAGYLYEYILYDENDQIVS